MNLRINIFLATRLKSFAAGATSEKALCDLAAKARMRSSGRHLGFSGVAYQSGVGLIEILVAVLVLSIAFLGIAALQAVSLSTSNSAMARSMATISTYSILDAMRADGQNAKAGLYNQTNMLTNNCPASGSTLESVQIYQWCTQLGQKLGVSAYTIGTINCQTTGRCKVTVQFDDSRSGSGGSKTQLVSTVAYL